MQGWIEGLAEPALPHRPSAGQGGWSTSGSDPPAERHRNVRVPLILMMTPMCTQACTSEPEKWMLPQESAASSAMTCNFMGQQMCTRKERCLSMASFFLASSWLCRLYTITRSAFFQNCITYRRTYIHAQSCGLRLSLFRLGATVRRGSVPCSVL